MKEFIDLSEDVRCRIIDNGGTVFLDLYDDTGNNVQITDEAIVRISGIAAELSARIQQRKSRVGHDVL